MWVDLSKQLNKWHISCVAIRNTVCCVICGGDSSTNHLEGEKLCHTELEGCGFNLSSSHSRLASEVVLANHFVPIT